MGLIKLCSKFITTLAHNVSCQFGTFDIIYLLRARHRIKGYLIGAIHTKFDATWIHFRSIQVCVEKVHACSHSFTSGVVHTKIDLSWIDLRSISVRFEKVFTLI